MGYVLGDWQVQGVVRAGSGFPFTLSGTNVCQCGSFVPQRVNYAPGREDDRGKLDDPTQTRWYDPTAYVSPAPGFQVARNAVIALHASASPAPNGRQAYRALALDHARRWALEYAISDDARFGLVLRVAGIHETQRMHAIDLTDERRVNRVPEHRTHALAARPRGVRRHNQEL